MTRTSSARFHAEGKDHLCIAPHKALHYFPFHLLNYLGKPLAESWAVSFLPNLNLLVAGRGRPHLRWHRGLPLASIGMSYSQPPLNPWNLPELQDALEEAKEAAAIFDTEPIIELQATAKQIKDAMTRSKYVHLSLHGAQAQEAPAFHCLLVARRDFRRPAVRSRSLTVGPSRRRSAHTQHVRFGVGPVRRRR